MYLEYRMLKSVVSGMASFVFPDRYNAGLGGASEDPAYCYSVYMRHAVRIFKATGTFDPKSVAEIGPGQSVGIGVASLIGGADQYYGFDIQSYGTPESALTLFDQLVEMFKARRPIPGPGEFPAVNPVLDDYDFPSEIFDEARLAACLSEERLGNIRAQIVESMGKNAGPIQYKAPWYTSDNPGEKIDWVFSQAVLEHVDDLVGTYQAMKSWMDKTSISTHQIDFKSHGLTSVWNGHWAYTPATWVLVRGKRPYLLNRATYADHVGAIGQSGMRIIDEVVIKRDDGLQKEDLHNAYKHKTDTDLRTAGAFVVFEQ